jgi:hypothetical protein
MEGNTQQLELFSGSGKPYQAGGHNRSTFISYIRGYEKIILLTIGVIVIAVIAFSLGVEKGKTMVSGVAVLTPDKNVGTAALIRKQELPVRTSNIDAASAAVKVAVPVAAKDRLQNYTIQLASFQSRDSAQKEAALLKKKGLAAVVISKGNYSILCVGSFNSKETAEPLLSQLKKKYQDSFIRRL